MTVLANKLLHLPAFVGARMSLRSGAGRKMPSTSATGNIIARTLDMPPEDVGNRITRARGRIESGHFQADAQFELHHDPSGRALFVVFEEHPDDLPDGTVVQVRLPDGRVLHCQVLGDSPLCSVVTPPEW